MNKLEEEIGRIKVIFKSCLPYWAVQITNNNTSEKVISVSVTAKVPAFAAEASKLTPMSSPTLF